MVFPVDLDKSSGTLPNIQQKINVNQNPMYLHKIISVCGDIKIDKEVLRIANIKKVIIDGKLYDKNNPL